MKIQKFNEMADVHYKEYDEYANIDMDILKKWKSDLNEIDEILFNIKHDIHQYNDFVKEFVVFVDEKKIFIPSKIELDTNDTSISYSQPGKSIIFKDFYSKYRVNMLNITDIKSIDEVANNNQKLFMELYNFYIKEKRAPYMDVFGKEEFEHIIDADKKYNL